MKELVYFMVHIMDESVTGTTINSIQFDLLHVTWTWKLH